MKRFKKCIVAVMIAGLLLSFVCVCSLYAYPAHTHKSSTTHCVLCTIAANVDSLLHTPGNAGQTAMVALLLLLFAPLLTVGQTRQEERRKTPIGLKTKLTT